MRLSTSDTLNDNIPSYKGKRLTLGKPQSVLYLLSTDVDSAFHKILITRYSGIKDYVVLMVAPSPFGSHKAFFDALWNQHIPSELLIHYDIGKPSVRVGVTIDIEDTQGKALILRMLNIIDIARPLPMDIQDIIACFTAKHFVNPNALDSIPYLPLFGASYFKPNKFAFPFAPHQANFREYEADLGGELPDIHRAILHNDVLLTVKLLSENPALVHKKDPWGIKAHQLAYYLGNLPLYECIVHARKRCPTTSSNDESEQFLGEQLLEIWQDTGFITCAPFGLPPSHKIAQECINQHKKNYEALINGPLPVRSSLHLACIAGTLDTIEKILESNPHRINEPDGLGYTPLLLAAVHGNAQLVQRLLKKGASHQTVIHNNALHGVTVLKLLDNAATPEVLQALLKVRWDQKEIKDQLCFTIARNDYSRAKALSYYYKQWRVLDKNHNVTPSWIELALGYGDLYHHKTSELIKTLLMSHDFPIELGFTFKAESSTFDLLNNHNKKIITKAKSKSLHVQHEYDYIEGNQLISKFESSHLTIQSILKRVEDLTEDEIKKIHALFFSTFEMMYDNSEENQQAYLAHALEDSDERPSYINCFYDGETLVAFMTFELFEIDNHIIFHGKLAGNCNAPQYTSQQLIALVFRALAATKLQMHDKKVFVYVKAISPGLGLSVAMPGMSPEYYPKYQRDITEDFVKKIVEATGEELTRGKIPAKLRVKGSRKLDETNLPVSWFFSEAGRDGKNALGVCYEMTLPMIKQYLKSLSTHHIDGRALMDFVSMWKEFTGATQHLWLRSKL